MARGSSDGTDVSVVSAARSSSSRSSKLSEGTATSAHRKKKLHKEVPKEPVKPPCTTEMVRWLLTCTRLRYLIMHSHGTTIQYHNLCQVPYVSIHPFIVHTSTDCTIPLSYTRFGLGCLSWGELRMASAQPTWHCRLMAPAWPPPTTWHAMSICRCCLHVTTSLRTSRRLGILRASHTLTFQAISLQMCVRNTMVWSQHYLPLPATYGLLGSFLIIRECMHLSNTQIL